MGVKRETAEVVAAVAVGVVAAVKAVREESNLPDEAGLSVEEVGVKVTCVVVDDRGRGFGIKT